MPLKPWMTAALDKIKRLDRSKWLVAAGLCGLLLLAVSSLTPKRETAVPTAAFSAEDYREKTEQSVRMLVQKITGDRKATVVVTLESGLRYDYAAAGNTASASDSQSKTVDYPTLRDADGSEQPLTVTEYMPKIRGVAVVCRGGNSAQVANRVSAAVTAALQITSKRVYITGGNES